MSAMNRGRRRLVSLLALTASAAAWSGAPAHASAPSGPDLSESRVVLIHSQAEGDAFGDLVYSGLVRLNAETGAEIRLIPDTQATAYEQQVRAMAQQGYDPVLVLWDDLANVVSELAPEFPDTNFIILDSTIDPGLDNVQTVTIDPSEASYLAGVYASLVTESGIAGFAGGADQPVIQVFRCGFEAGFTAANPEHELLVSFVGDFNDPAKGEQVADALIAQGADVIMHAANQSGLGVLRAAAAADIFGIGVDFRQADVAPGHVPWSALKDAGTATYHAALQALSGNFTPGLFNWGAAQGAALYDPADFEALPDELKVPMQETIDGLASGGITVDC